MTTMSLRPKCRIEGFHALKHALRFGAEVVEVEAASRDEVVALAQRLAPDLATVLGERVREVPDEGFDGVTGRVRAGALRPEQNVDRVLRERGDGPVVLLDHPRHLGNVGAAIRVAAAANADALVTTGTADPWHPLAIRGAAGLQWALPVGRVEEAPRAAPVEGGERFETERPIVALDPEGEPLAAERVPRDAILAFGSERRGLSDEVRAAADLTVSLPMRAGVSSINLAAAVAATLYALRLGAGSGA
ncbi:MAG TPA: TrmH family RNA methyltransferase [Solirubrobacteraceae bacterium]|nr:TrmH family RNA methyltransferase [Solirubrobacteraceae bacterium]